MVVTVMLDGIEVKGHRLNQQQLSAVTCESLTTLVLAGAGTGKTTTLIGRVKHLMSTGVDPSDILLISLTNNTVNDLREALVSEFGEGFRASVMTIHSLGHRIVGKESCVGAVKTALFLDIIQGCCQSDRVFAGGILDWVEGMRSSGYADICYDGESIPSRNLRALGDALFRYDVRFSYEPARMSENGFIQGYIEIEGIGLRIHHDDNLAKEAVKGEVEAIQVVKRLVPEATPSNINDFATGILLAWGDRIPDSMASMVSRCKRIRCSIHDLRSRLDRVDASKRMSVGRRLDVLDRVWDMYSLECTDRNLTDFDDMVLQAVAMIDSGYEPGFSFTHILVDEYQDASPVMVDLIRALRRIWGSELFCAGDDWQSIYSFSGGDVWQTYGFEDSWKDWSPVSVMRVEHTYRHPQQIADMAGRFIMKNPSQLPKAMDAPVSERFPVQLLPVESDRDIPRMIYNRLDFIDPEDSVFVIGRTRADVYALRGRSGLFNISASSPSGTIDVTCNRIDPDTREPVPYRTIRFLTAHSAKGLEADWVFLLADRDRGGFPNTTSDVMDVLFDCECEGIPYAEERRVFYVAMTRARKGMFMVNRMEDGYALSSEGVFMSEVIEDNIRQFSHSSPFCPECIGPMRIMRGPEGLFYGCVAYPSCKGVRPIQGRPF